MGNVKFKYLYRDSSNYKKWGDIVFSNPDNLEADAVVANLRDAFLQGEVFIAHQIRVPEVFLVAEYPLTSDDHCFHEFDSVETTPEAPNDLCGRSIRDFVAEAVEEAKHGWRAFNPQDRLPTRSTPP